MTIRSRSPLGSASVVAARTCPRIATSVAGRCCRRPSTATRTRPWNPAATASPSRASTTTCRSPTRSTRSSSTTASSTSRRPSIDRFRTEYGLTGGVSVRLHNDAPPGSGLGSSSAICVALVGALAAHARVGLDPYQLAELAYRIEREDAGIRGGRQDQYATAFGGFNFIEFEHGTTVVNPLRLRDETRYELEYGLVFAYVGGQHFSSRIIEGQVGNYERGRDVRGRGDGPHQGTRLRDETRAAARRHRGVRRAARRRLAGEEAHGRRHQRTRASTRCTPPPATPGRSAARSRAPAVAASCSSSWTRRGGSPFRNGCAVSAPSP